MYMISLSRWYQLPVALQACDYIDANHLLQNILYVAPKRKLLRQTPDMLAIRSAHSTFIDSDESQNVVKAVISFLNESPDYARVLLITWKTLSNLSYFHHREHWLIIR
jgi:superfamily II DNA or RNA helicase